MATVNLDQDQPINVRAGPSQDYPIVGLLEQGEKVPALGRSVGGDWVRDCLSGCGWWCRLGVCISGDYIWR